MTPSGAMFLFLFFLLSPAVAQQPCPNKQAVLRLFDIIDTNNDNTMTRQETDAFFKEFDINYDKVITREEVEKADVAPELSGFAPELFAFLDVNGDNVITSKDVDILYSLIDTNKDGTKSRREYKTYLKRVCQPERPYANAKTTERPYANAKTTERPYANAKTTERPYANAKTTERPYAYAK